MGRPRMLIASGDAALGSLASPLEDPEKYLGRPAGHYSSVPLASLKPRNEPFPARGFQSSPTCCQEAMTASTRVASIGWPLPCSNAAIWSSALPVPRM